jgi:hypothetical protein
MLLSFLRWQKSFVYGILQYIVKGLFWYERSIDMSVKRWDKEIVFSATERANVKTDDMRLNTLMPQANSNLFTVGNWKRRTERHKANGMIFH